MHIYIINCVRKQCKKKTKQYVHISKKTKQRCVEYCGKSCRTSTDAHTYVIFSTPLRRRALLIDFSTLSRTCVSVCVRVMHARSSQTSPSPRLCRSNVYDKKKNSQKPDAFKLNLVKNNNKNIATNAILPKCLQNN